MIPQYAPPIEGMNLPTILYLDPSSASLQRRRRGAHLAATMGDTSGDLNTPTGVVITESPSDTSTVLEPTFELLRQSNTGIDSSQFQSFITLPGARPRLLFNPSSATDLVRISVNPTVQL